MIPVTTQNSESSGCVYQSAKCVVWEEGTLPCIDDICLGTSIQDIIGNIATRLCTLEGEFDQTWDNFTNLSCIYTGEEDPPEGQEEIIQAIINTLCGIEDADKSLTCSCEEETVVLSKCHLHPGMGFSDLENPILITDAVERLSEVICAQDEEFGAEIYENRINISNLTEIVNNITLAPVIYEIPTITTQCASGDAPGEIIPITDAFETFEETYCNFIDHVGTDEEITDAIAKQCEGLCGIQTCASEKETYCDLTGWVQDPQSLSDSLGNLWIYICDQRSCVIEPVIPCVALPPVDFTINYTTSNFTVTFHGHGSSEIQEALSYTLKIYNIDSSGQSTGLPLSTHTVVSGTPISNVTLSPSQNYVLKLTATYTCGVSEEAIYIGLVKTCTVSNKIYLRKVETSTVEDCKGVSFDEYTFAVHAELQTLGGAIVSNTTGTDISMRLVLTVTDPLLANDIEEVYNLTIPINSTDSNVVSYISVSEVYTGTVCEDFFRGNTQSRVNIDEISACNVSYSQTDTNIKV